MTTAEAIAAARRGERVSGPHSLHAAEGESCPGFNHARRTLFCDSETDVVECRRCGEQACGNCRHWLRVGDTQGGDGECHRHAPRPSASPKGEVHWPLTYGDEFCGEWGSPPVRQTAAPPEKGTP